MKEKKNVWKQFGLNKLRAEKLVDVNKSFIRHAQFILYLKQVATHSWSALISLMEPEKPFSLEGCGPRLIYHSQATDVPLI